MGSISEYFSLFLLLISGIMFGLKSQAGYSPTSTQDLYGDSIYIKKSSAETPSALESSERLEGNRYAAIEKNEIPEISINDPELDEPLTMKPIEPKKKSQKLQAKASSPKKHSKKSRR
jgi:hypothetical protein